MLSRRHVHICKNANAYIQTRTLATNTYIRTTALKYNRHVQIRSNRMKYVQIHTQYTNTCKYAQTRTKYEPIRITKLHTYTTTDNDAQMPTNTCAYVPACLIACLPACLHASTVTSLIWYFLVCLLACLLACFLACLRVCLYSLHMLACWRPSLSTCFWLYCSPASLLAYMLNCHACLPTCPLPWVPISWVACLLPCCACLLKNNC